MCECSFCLHADLTMCGRNHYQSCTVRRGFTCSSIGESCVLMPCPVLLHCVHAWRLQNLLEQGLKSAAYREAAKVQKQHGLYMSRPKQQALKLKQHVEVLCLMRGVLHLNDTCVVLCRASYKSTANNSELATRQSLVPWKQVCQQDVNEYQHCSGDLC